jgi:PiT family inorganic phosphate transporter
VESRHAVLDRERSPPVRRSARPVDVRHHDEVGGELARGDRGGSPLGGRRIIRTLGKRVTEIETPQGFGAETSSSAVILVSSHLGFPLSTTQVATGSIFGAGAGKRLSEVHWGIAGQPAVAWALTLPAAAVVGALAASVAETGTLGTVMVAVAAAALGIYALSRRDVIGPHNVNESPASPASTAVTAAA